MDELLQRHLKRMRKIAQEQGVSIDFTFREQLFFDAHTQQWWLLKQFPFMQHWVYSSKGEIKTIEIPAPCFVLTPYQKP